MKKRSLGIAVLAAVSVVLAGCGSSSSGGTSTSTAAAGGGGTSKPTVANVINGPLGDQGFFDDANRGMEQLKSSGFKTQVIQSDANNPAQWKSNLESVAGKWGIVIVGTTQMHDILNADAPKYPNQKFVIYDDVVKQPNVASIVYKQNEGSYLAGVLAAEVTTNKAKFPNATGSKTVGLVGGMDIPVINDFVVGFKKGVSVVDPSIQVKVSYVGSFTDSEQGLRPGQADVRPGRGRRLPGGRGRRYRRAEGGGGGQAATPSASTRTRTRSSPATCWRRC